MSTAPLRLSTDERRRQILSVAREEFLARGYAGARIQSVADTAGVTPALIYKHFESKEKLFEEAVMGPLHGVLEAHIEDVRLLPPDPSGTAQRESTQRFMTSALRMFTESVESLGVILFGDRTEAHRFYAGHFRPLIDRAIEASRANFNRWPHRDFDLETAVQSAFGIAFWVALDRSMRPEQSEHTERERDAALEEQATKLANLLFDGISARPDHDRPFP